MERALAFVDKVTRKNPLRAAGETEKFANPSTGHVRPANQDSTTAERV